MSNEYLFVGDSREVFRARDTQGVRAVSGKGKFDAIGEGQDGNFYYTSGGKDIGWFEDNIKNIANQAKEQNSDYVVVSMGANDWPRFTTQTEANRFVQRYIAAAKKIEQQSGKKVVFVSPYPLNGPYETNVHNKNIPHEKKDMDRYLGYFNNALRDATKLAGMGYIDGFTYGQKYVGKKQYWYDSIHGSKALSQDFGQFIQRELDKLPQRTRTATGQQMQADATQARLETQVAERELRTPSTNGVENVATDEVTNSVYGDENKLTKAQKASMEKWARSIKLSSASLKQLQEKYGEYSYNIMLRAMMEPANLMEAVGKEKPRVNSKTAVEYMISHDFTDDQMTKALSGKYGTQYDANTRTDAPVQTATTFEPEVTTGTALETSVPAQQYNGRRLTIGDSRTVGMACSGGKGIKYKRVGNRPAKVDENDSKGNRWFAEEGKGLAWMQSNISTIKERAQDCDQIVINLGVNDIGGNPNRAAKNYIAYINQLAKEWKAQGKEVIFTSVNPVDDTRCAAPKNKDIEQFNKLMREGLSTDVTFVDTYSNLKGNAQYKLISDGLHCANYAYVDVSMNDSIDRALGRYAEARSPSKGRTGSRSRRGRTNMSPRARVSGGRA